MTSFEREDRSFVGCGEEEYPKGDISSRTAPVGYGLRDEILTQADRSRLLFEERMVRRSGVDGTPTKPEGLMAKHAEQSVAPHITVIGDPRRMTCGQFCSAIGLTSTDDSVLRNSRLQEYRHELLSYRETYLFDWLGLIQMNFADFRSMLPSQICFRDELWRIPRPETGEPTIVTVFPDVDRNAGN